CAMMRLGLKVPETVLVPYKNPVDHDKYAFTSQRYNEAFDLDAIAAGIGYPLYMKPYDGGGWRGVSRINNPDELHSAYNSSGEMLVREGDVYPIDYANACPDISVTSLHYYFPWAIKTLLKWTVFCLATGRRARLDTDTRTYFDISDRSDLDYGQKLGAYRRLADE